jgi:hypothetical protein
MNKIVISNFGHPFKKLSMVLSHFLDFFKCQVSLSQGLDKTQLDVEQDQRM